MEDYREEITGLKKTDFKYAPSYPKLAPIVNVLETNSNIAEEDSERQDCCGAFPRS